MRATRRLSRRSFLAAVAGTALVGKAAIAAPRSDNDTGPRADPPGRGTRTGLTDQDSSDRPGRGTHSGINDQDPGDPVGRGRGCSDADPSDRPARGRRC